jgi:hypothetical protein
MIENSGGNVPGVTVDQGTSDLGGYFSDLNCLGGRRGETTCCYLIFLPGPCSTSPDQPCFKDKERKSGIDGSRL